MEGWVDIGTAVSVQPVPKAAYRSDFRENTNYCPQRDSNLGPLAQQTSVLPLDHCDLQYCKHWANLNWGFIGICWNMAELRTTNALELPRSFFGARIHLKKRICRGTGRCPLPLRNSVSRFSVKSLVLLPPAARFKVENAPKSISAGALSHTDLLQIF